MKILKITTENRVFSYEYPKGTTSQQEEELQKLIGDSCDCYEHVMPMRLYTELGAPRVRNNCVSILVDECGRPKKLPVNLVGSYLYESDMHGSPIVGNILVVGERWTADGVTFDGIPDDVYMHLYPKLEDLARKAREGK